LDADQPPWTPCTVTGTTWEDTPICASKSHLIGPIHEALQAFDRETLIRRCDLEAMESRPSTFPPLSTEDLEEAHRCLWQEIVELRVFVAETLRRGYGMFLFHP